MSTERTSRRDFLRLFGLGAAAVLAGCVGVRLEGGVSVEGDKEKDLLNEFLTLFGNEGVKEIVDLVWGGVGPEQELANEIIEGILETNDGNWANTALLLRGVVEVFSTRFNGIDGIAIVRKVNTGGSSGFLFRSWDGQVAIKAVEETNRMRVESLQRALERMKGIGKILGYEDFEKSRLVGFKFRGRNWIGLEMPWIDGETLGGRVKWLMNQGKVDEARNLLLETYKNVLLPMNQVGWVQPDPNLRNFIVGESDGRIFPIDLDIYREVAMVSSEGVEKSWLLYWQYENFRARVRRYNIELPDWFSLVEGKFDDEFVKNKEVLEEIRGKLWQVLGKDEEKVSNWLNKVRQLRNVFGEGNDLVLVRAPSSSGQFVMRFYVEADWWGNLTKEDRMRWIERFRDAASRVERGQETAGVGRVIEVFDASGESSRFILTFGKGKGGTELVLRRVLSGLVGIADLLMLVSVVGEGMSRILNKGVNWSSEIMLELDQAKRKRLFATSDLMTIFFTVLVKQDPARSYANIDKFFDRGGGDYLRMLGVDVDYLREVLQILWSNVDEKERELLKLKSLAYLTSILLHVPGPLVPVNVEFGSAVPGMFGGLERVEGLYVTGYYEGDRETLLFVKRGENGEVEILAKVFRVDDRWIMTPPQVDISGGVEVQLFEGVVFECVELEIEDEGKVRLVCEKR